MWENINKIYEQLITITDQMTSFQNSIAAQDKAIKETSSRCYANTNANIMLFSALINANPSSKDIIIDSITKALDHLANIGSKDKAFDSYLKAQLSELLKFLQSPQKHPHLRLLKNEPDGSNQ